MKNHRKKLFVIPLPINPNIIVFIFKKLKINILIFPWISPPGKSNWNF